jgi:uncharacterized SAM-binding protein YcdF (DUF218 family)
LLIQVAPSFHSWLMLSGWVQPANEVLRVAELGDDTLRRCRHAVRLYQRSGPCRVVVSEGMIEANEAGLTLAEAMRRFLIEHGVADESILLEDRSRNTFENARETADLLPREGVTSVVSCHRRHSPAAGYTVL